MIRRKVALFRLCPTPDQASHMAQIAGACRFVYNLALSSAATGIGPDAASRSPASVRNSHS
jgi:hypothetical protein